MSGAAVPLRRLLNALTDAKVVLVDEFGLSLEIDPMMLALRSLESALGEFFDIELSQTERDDATIALMAEARALERHVEPQRVRVAPVLVRFPHDEFVVVRPDQVRA